MAKHVLRLVASAYQQIISWTMPFSITNVVGMEIAVDDDVVLEELADDGRTLSGRKIERKVSCIIYLESWNMPRYAFIAYYPETPLLPEHGNARLRDLQLMIDQHWGSLQPGKPRLEASEWSALRSIMSAAGTLSSMIERSEIEGAKSLGEEQNDVVSKSLADLVIASARFASRWTGKRIDLGAAVVSRVAERFPVKKTIGAWRDPVPMILEEIEKERARQRLKWGRSDTDHPLVHPRNGGVHLGFYGIPEAHDAVERKEVECDNERDDWMLILVAEVSRFGQDAIHGRWEGARKGAVRIAAVAAAIVESIDTKLAVEKGRRSDK